MSYASILEATAVAIRLPVSLYGLVIAVYLGLKFLGALRYEPATADPPTPGEGPRVSVVIPEYNERPDLMARCLDSILEQSYPIHQVFVTDDGSDDTGAWDVARRYAAEHDRIHTERFDENRGKRHAQAAGFERATGDIYVTVDSDTVLEPDAVERILEPFADESVTAATGYPRVINRGENVLTQLIHMRYWTAFNVDRAARSTLGLVTCCCGVFSAYRASVVDDCLEDYCSQRFLGTECTFGDDRHLTAYALRTGRVVYQRTAVAYTDAPESLRTYVKQQVRWMRSFWRESVLALGWSPSRSVVLTAMILAEMSLPIALLGFGLSSVLYRSLFLGSVASIVGYVGVVSLMAYVRNVFFSRVGPRTYLLSPLYGLLYFSILLSLTFYALATVRANHWGTR